MALAEYTEANDWLQGTKISFASDADALPESREADRIIKAKLYDAFGDAVNDWEFDGTGDDETPSVVRAIASLLMAAYRYQKIYSEETRESPDFATKLEKRAMDLIEGLRSGEIELNDSTLVSGLAFSQLDFWPNDTTISETTGEALRFAKMEDTF